MKNWKKVLSLLLVLVMVAGILAGCGKKTQGGAASGTQYGGHLNVRTVARPNGLDPLKQTGAWKYMFTTCVYENPLTRDAENNIAPGVCNYELSEDMLTLKLTVREGVKFQNGDDVTIEDVEASINRSLTLYNNIKKYVAPYVASMTVEGDTLTMVFSEYREKCLYYIAAYQTWMAVMPKEICEKYNKSFIVDQIEDCIGTGPYMYSDFKDSEYVTVTKWKDYVPLESDRTGFAGPKYGYMDSISFIYNAVDATVALGFLNYEYDMVEVLPAEFKSRVESQDMGVQELQSNQGTFMIFNTKGKSNPCAKYPSLRKAVMAAIDYDEFLGVVTDESHTGEAQMSTMEQFKTDVFEKADYFGPANKELAQKYLEEARAQGYDDDPIKICYSNARTDILALMGSYMKKAGIPYETETMESATYTSFIAEPSNDWDCYFTWLGVPFYPSLIQDAIIATNWDSAERERIVDEMGKYQPNTTEYANLWTEYATLIANECPVGVMSLIDWWWWTPNTLHVECDSVQQYVYNTWWEDPENHPAP